MIHATISIQSCRKMFNVFLLFFFVFMLFFFYFYVILSAKGPGKNFRAENSGGAYADGIF